MGRCDHGHVEAFVKKLSFNLPQTVGGCAWNGSLSFEGREKEPSVKHIRNEVRRGACSETEEFVVAVVTHQCVVSGQDYFVVQNTGPPLKYLSAFHLKGFINVSFFHVYLEKCISVVLQLW